MSELVRHLVIVGATASGKSDVAIELAKRLDPVPEIISLDSMQIYSGMEIGTGVVPDSKRNEIRHHLIGSTLPTQEHSVKQFQDSVYELLNDSPENKYILVGGTGLYTHAIIDGFAFAPTNPQSREQIIQKYDLDESNPNFDKVAVAYEILSNLDPDAAAKIDPLNVRRIVRALEAIEIGEVKFSQIGDGVQNFGKPKIDVSIFGLMYSRDVLRQRISDRIENMFEAGRVNEVKLLMPIWEEMTAPARNAIGYSLIVDWIKDGEKPDTFGKLKERIINKTAQFSRRQRKWFERDPRIRWISCDGRTQESIVQEIFSELAD